MAAVLICGIILCIWGVNILHNSSKQEETVSSEESSTTSTTAYQTETATQTTTQPDTEEAYFEEDTEEEVQIENAVKELRKHIAWYTKNLKNSSNFRSYINTVESKEELVDKIEEYWKNF